MQDMKLTTEKHAAALRAILMAMRIRWYSVKRITQYSMSRAILDATIRSSTMSLTALLFR